MVKIYAKVGNEEKRPGEELFSKLDTFISKTEENVDVDFSNITAIPSIYFSNSIGKLVDKYDLDTITKRIHLSNYNSQMAGAINLAVNLAIEHRKSKKYLLVRTDGYEIDSQLIEHCDDTKALLQEEYNKYLPEEGLEESCAEMSFVTDTEAMLYNNGNDVYSWKMIKI